jgi:hypothetical protein
MCRLFRLFQQERTARTPGTPRKESEHKPGPTLVLLLLLLAFLASWRFKFDFPGAIREMLKAGAFAAPIPEMEPKCIRWPRDLAGRGSG